MDDLLDTPLPVGDRGVPDSEPLAARMRPHNLKGIADRLNIPCGREIIGNNSHSEFLDEFEFNRMEEPPPAKPQPPPSNVGKTSAGLTYQAGT